ncbi:hypothetical protein Q9L58_010721 [Maublancomyces gigas]|uniref:Uncharacterized protein n=1 Tax=Discina gigas TaxID=1032678 RepID=A0ABR3G3X6_9PEZI
MAAVLVSCSSSTVVPAAAIREECKENSVTVIDTATSDALYVDRAYLRILVNPFGDSYGLNDIVSFMLLNGYSTLDTTNRDRNGNELIYDRELDNSAIRISIKSLGDPACDAFDYTKRYPAQAWPWLRRLGIQLDECIGVERISANERSALRIFVNENVMHTQSNGFWWQSRLDVRVVDSSITPERVLARLTDHYGGSGGGKTGYHHRFLCEEGDRQIRTFSRAFASTGDRHRAPEVLEGRNDSREPVLGKISDDEFRKLVWIVTPRKIWSSNIIDPRGTVWVSWAPKGLDNSYTFNTFLGNSIFSARISLPEKRGLQDITGLAAITSGWAVVAGINIRSPGSKRYLVEINLRGEVIKLAELTESQYEMLSRIE